MKNLAILIISAFVCVTSVFSQKKGGVPDNSKHTVFYTCPMHEDIKEIKAGDCPKCGMKLQLSGKELAKAAVMKNYTCPVHLDVVSHDPGKCPQCGKKLNLSPKEQMKAETMKMYTCPMHPEVSLDKDGKCPKCGKALVEKKS
ncbi:MAG: heavy metal-binding domain-containing protein [Bacteroidota bacterium]